MANQIVVEMTGQEAKLWQSLQKVIGQQNKVEGGFKKIGTAAGAAGTKATGLWSPRHSGPRSIRRPRPTPS